MPVDMNAIELPSAESIDQLGQDGGDFGAASLTGGFSEKSEAPEPNQAKEAPKPKKPDWDGKLVLEVDGQKMVVDMNNPSDRERVRREYQLRKASDQRIGKAQELIKKYNEFSGSLKDKTKLIETLKQEGVDENLLEEAFTDWYYEKIKEKELTPEQKEALQSKRELEKLKKEKEEREQFESRQALEREADQLRATLEPQIIKETQNLGLPQVKFTFERAIHHMQNAEAQGYNLSPKDAAAYAKDDVNDVIHSVISRIDVPNLIKLLGEKTVNAIRQYRVEQISKNKPFMKSELPPMPQKQPERMSKEQAKELIRKRASLI